MLAEMEGLTEVTPRYSVRTRTYGVHVQGGEVESRDTVARAIIAR